MISFTQINSSEFISTFIQIICLLSGHNNTAISASFFHHQINGSERCTRYESVTFRLAQRRCQYCSRQSSDSSLNSNHPLLVNKNRSSSEPNTPKHHNNNENRIVMFKVVRYKIGSPISDTIAISSGVPQGVGGGGILRLYSFSFFINDVFRRRKFSHFSDDLKVYPPASSISDADGLQSDLSRPFDWCVHLMAFLRM